MALRLRLVAHSEVGLVRKNNQDSGFAGPNLVVVADGMGGAAAGDLASAVAIDAMRSLDTTAHGDEMLGLLSGALSRANERIADLVEEDHRLEGMGTTFTGALFDGTELGLAHIGDSRAYLLRDGRMKRLTHDHSWVQSLIDDGKISEAEAAVHPHRSLLLRVLNGQRSAHPDLSLVDVHAGDRLLFCSDGLCGLIDDDDIAEAIRHPELDSVLRELVGLAHGAGGIDNITIILADVVDDAGTSEAVVLGAASEPGLLDGYRPPDLAEDTVVTERATASAEGAATDVHAPDDEARYNPQPPHNRRLRRPMLIVVAALLIVGAGLGAAYAWTRTQFYVGASRDQVAIFKGVSERIPGVHLSRVYEVQPLTVSSLPPYYQEKVRATIDVDTLTAARQVITELNQAAIRCANKPPRLPGSASPSAPMTRPAPTAPAKTTPSKTTPTKTIPAKTTPASAPTTVRPSSGGSAEPNC